MTSFDSQTWRTGIPAIGLAGSSRARRIYDVVCADDEDDIGFGKAFVDLFHLENDVVWNVGFGEQDVHMSGQASGDRMNGEAHVNIFFAQNFHDFGERMLCLRDRQTVAGNDDD